MSSKAKIVNPREYFSQWHYTISESFWPSLGVERREYIDKEKTQLARTRAIEERKINHAQSLRIRITFFAYAIQNQPSYDFHQGDIFYGKDDALQISAIHNLIEVYRFIAPRYVYACHVTERQLVEWLRSGIEPSGSKIDKLSGWCETTKYLLLE